jgi:hypothetical protein
LSVRATPKRIRKKEKKEGELGQASGFQDDKIKMREENRAQTTFNLANRLRLATL